MFQAMDECPEDRADERLTLKREIEDRLKRLQARVYNHPDPRNPEHDLYLGFQWKLFLGGEVGMTKIGKVLYRGFTFCCFFFLSYPCWDHSKTNAQILASGGWSWILEMQELMAEAKELHYYTWQLMVSKIPCTKASGWVFDSEQSWNFAVVPKKVWSCGSPILGLMLFHYKREKKEDTWDLHLLFLLNFLVNIIYNIWHSMVFPRT